MSTTQQNGNHTPRPKSFWIELASKYERNPFARFVRAIEPLSIMFAAVGVVLAIAGLIFAAWAVKLSFDEIAEGRKLHQLTLQEVDESRKLHELTLEEIEESRQLRQETLREFAENQRTRAATIREMNETQKFREATLFVSLMERLDLARQSESPQGQSPKSATYEKDKTNKEWKCQSTARQLRARAGQIPVIERMSSLGISLRDLVANNVNLVVRRPRKSELPGINLTGAKLSGAILKHSNLKAAELTDAILTGADLERTCLREANLERADLTNVDLFRADLQGANLEQAKLVNAGLRYAWFHNTNLSGAILRNADITGAHLRRADGLTQSQLDEACANPKKRQPSVPRKLVWKGRECL